jgi:hypothetical protein
MKFVEYYKERKFNKKLLETYGKYKVFLVSGKEVRDYSTAAQEFGGSGEHRFYPKVIPKNEIWIGDDIKLDERKILIASELYKIRLIDNGMSLNKAYKEQLKKEKDYRESVCLSKKNPLASNRSAKKGIHIKQYGTIDGLDVWVVDGKQVRNLYKVDWIEGGNPAVYPFCPNDEIWIEQVKEQEFPLIILHEFVEYILMKHKKLSYDKAHRIASKIEFAYREKGFSKSEALSLTKEKVLEIVKSKD